MKRLILLITISLFLSGCTGFGPSFTVLSGSDLSMQEETVEYTARAGLYNDNTEFGLTGSWSEDASNDWRTIGIYAQRKLLYEPNDIFIGEIFFGSQASIAINEGDQGMYGFYLSKITNLYGIDIATELHYRKYSDALNYLSGSDESDKYRLIIGPRFRF